MMILTPEEAKRFKQSLEQLDLEQLAAAIGKAIAEHHVIMVSGIDIGRLDAQTGGTDDQG